MKKYEIGSFYVNNTYKPIEGIDEVNIFFLLNFKILV